MLVEEAFGPGGAGRGPFLLEAVNINGLLTFLWVKDYRGIGAGVCLCTESLFDYC